MENKNLRRTLGDYSKPSHEGYRNTIEIPDGNNMVPLRSDTIRLVQNGCSFHGLRSEDPNQHLKDFLKLVDSLDLNGDNRERTRLFLFQFPLRDQASNWLECLPAGSISIWEDLTNRFLAEFFPPERTSKLPGGRLRKMSPEKAWTTIEELAQYEEDEWIVSKKIWQSFPRPSRQKEFEGLMTNFILDQEEKVRQLEGYMSIIGNKFMQLSLKVMEKLKDEIRIKGNTKIKKITKFPYTKESGSPVDSKSLGSPLLGGEYRTMSLLELGWRVRLYSEEDSLENHTRISMQRALTIKAEDNQRGFWPNIGDGEFVGVVCHIPYWLARYMRRARDMNVLCGEMFVTRITRSFGLLSGAMVDALSVESRACTFIKKSLVTMEIVMELDGGTCCWPATRRIKEGNEMKEEVEDPAVAYQDMSRGDWQKRQG
ncbi:zinc finger, CCHC-type containing protein [Tanacetum coccineum]